MPVKVGCLQCQLTAPRIRKEVDAILEEAMFPCTVCDDGANEMWIWSRVVISTLNRTAEHISHAGPTHRPHSSPVDLRRCVLFRIFAAIDIETIVK